MEKIINLQILELLLQSAKTGSCTTTLYCCQKASQICIIAQFIQTSALKVNAPVIRDTVSMMTKQRLLFFSLLSYFRIHTDTGITLPRFVIISTCNAEINQIYKPLGL